MGFRTFILVCMLNVVWGSGDKQPNQANSLSERIHELQTSGGPALKLESATDAKTKPPQEAPISKDEAKARKVVECMQSSTTVENLCTKFISAHFNFNPKKRKSARNALCKQLKKVNDVYQTQLRSKRNVEEQVERLPSGGSIHKERVGQLKKITANIEKVEPSVKGILEIIDMLRIHGDADIDIELESSGGNSPSRVEDTTDNRPILTKDEMYEGASAVASAANNQGWCCMG